MCIISVYAATTGTINFPYSIVQQKAMMNPSAVTIDLGTMIYGETKSSTSIDSNSDLIVYQSTDISVALSNPVDFTAFSVTIELKQAGATQKSITVSKSTATGTISGVPVGSYDIFIAYSCTAGSSTNSGTVSVTLTC